jgi:hypothetical protein
MLLHGAGVTSQALYLASLQLDLRDAQPTNGERTADPKGTETRQVAAVARLRTLARDPGQVGVIPLHLRLQLRRVLMLEGMRILVADDPPAALRKILGQREPKRGKGRPREDNTDRNVAIAAYVAELRWKGMTLDEACRKVSRRPGISVDKKSIEAAYYEHRDHDAVLATLELLSGEGLKNPIPEIAGDYITPQQQAEYSALLSAERPNAMPFEDFPELWSFVRQASFP